MPPCDLLIHSASQLLTLAGGPQRGRALGALGIIEDGAVAVEGERILAVGKTADLHTQYAPRNTIDASGCVVMPGFVDPHTHAVWAGDRANEFEKRIGGATYMEIMAAGGGIMSTVRHTRAASVDQLVAETGPRLDRMLAYGTTTAEIKTGYGLETRAELRQLEAIERLQGEHPMTIVATFLGAHAVPEEYKGRQDAYVALVVEEMLPAVREWQMADSRWQMVGPRPSTLHPPLFADIFCEDGAFTVEQSRRVLETAKEMGFGLKIHADEFVGLGGTKLAVELGAASADHLVYTPEEDIVALGQGDTVAVGLPGTPFGLAQKDYTPASDILHAGGMLALATDLNPGTTWCESMQMVIALACRYMRLTPAQAIAAATINSAQAIGLAGEVGSLEPGKCADLVVLDAPSYPHLGYRYGTNLARTVIKSGKVVAGQ
jgi:imidazolonepropionase